MGDAGGVAFAIERGGKGKGGAQARRLEIAARAVVSQDLIARLQAQRHQGLVFGKRHEEAILAVATGTRQGFELAIPAVPGLGRRIEAGGV